MEITALPEDHSATLFSLESGHALLTRVCDRLGVRPGRQEERTFDDGEHTIRPLERVRDRDVYVVQSLYGDDEASVNDTILRTLFFLGAIRDAGAGRLTLVAPYLAYARKDRRTKPRDPVSIRYLATVFESIGVDRIVTIDVHNPAAYENAFRIPTIHLTAAPLVVDAVVPLIGDHEGVVVSPDVGGAKRAERLRQLLADELDRTVDLVFIEKFRSEGVVWGGTVVGDVDGRVAIIVDDVISSGTTLVGAARACREGGAYATYGAATHGLFSADASGTLGGSDLERLFLVDTLPSDRLDHPGFGRRVQVLPCASMLADAIHRLHTGTEFPERILG